MDIFQVIAHLIVSGTVHRENKSYLFFTNVVHQLVVVGSWEPCFPESQRCPAAAELPDDPRGGGQPCSPPVPCAGQAHSQVSWPPSPQYSATHHTLPPAQLPCTIQFLVILDWQCMTRLFCCCIYSSHMTLFKLQATNFLLKLCRNAIISCFRGGIWKDSWCAPVKCCLLRGSREQGAGVISPIFLQLCLPTHVSRAI